MYRRYYWRYSKSIADDITSSANTAMFNPVDILRHYVSWDTEMMAALITGVACVCVRRRFCHTAYVIIADCCIADRRGLPRAIISRSGSVAVRCFWVIWSPNRLIVLYRSIIAAACHYVTFWSGWILHGYRDAQNKTTRYYELPL